MSISTLIFTIIGVVLGVANLIALFAVLTVVGELLKRELERDIPEETATHTHKPASKLPIPDGAEDTFDEGFATAREHFWYILQLSIYDMYRKFEVLDFDTQLQEIRDRMTSLMDDEELRLEVIRELRQYYEGEES